MSFNADVARWAAKAKIKMEQVVEKTAELALESVIARSPVGDPSLWQYPAPPGYMPGTFKANWNVSLNVADESVNLAAKDESGAGTFAAGMATIEAVKPGDSIFIVNSVPYARRLEFGWSTQAPAGMVRLTIAALPSEIERYIASINS